MGIESVLKKYAWVHFNRADTVEPDFPLSVFWKHVGSRHRN